MSPRERLLRLWPYLWRYRRHFGVGALALIATNVLALQIPGQIGDAVEALRSAQRTGLPLDTSAIQRAGLAVAALAIGAMTTRVASRIAIFNGGRHVEYDVRNELFAHLLRQPIAYYQRASTGDLVSRIINDVTQIRLLFGVGVLNLVNTTFAYAIVLGFMWRLSPELTVWALAPYPFVLFAMRWFTRQLYVRTKDAQAQLSVVSGLAQECLSGAAVVQTFGIEAQTQAQFRARSEEYAHRNIAIARVRGGLMPFMRMVAGLGTLIVMIVGGRAVVDGALRLGEFVEFSGYVVMLAWPTMALGWVLSVYNRGTAAFDRSWQLLDAVPAIREPDLPEPLPDHGDIVFDRVSLVHDDGTRALEDISLRIRAGSTVALVGPTGAGKTTLVELIPRLRDPTSGEVRFGDVPLTRAPLAQLRERMSYAPQEGFLFSMTLDENIRYADPDDSDYARRDRAVAIAHLTPDLAALPAGLETVVGERGVTVSGGQRHRTTIARAIYARADVLLLDDALASVDTETERAILENLRDVLADRTCVLVTHRFNALDLVDEVFVLEDGRLVEHGDHTTLMARRGRYAELVEQQRLEREFDDAT